MKLLTPITKLPSLKSTDFLQFECLHCGNIFQRQKKYLPKKESGSNQCKYCCQKCASEHSRVRYKCNCRNCNIELAKTLSEIKKSKNVFCGRSCAAIFNNKLYKKQKTGFKVKKSLLTLNRKVIRFCINCNNQFYRINSEKTCSPECHKMRMSLAGLKSANKQAKNRRSKNETYFADLCKTKFANVLINENLFNGWDADIILPDLKIAILWNGKWHYEKITKKHSVKQVQNRDKIKIKEIIIFGYEPYVIKDLGKYSKKFVKEQFKIFLEKFLQS